MSPFPESWDYRWGVRSANSLVYGGDPNSSPHPRSTNVPSTEPPPQTSTSLFLSFVPCHPRSRNLCSSSPLLSCLIHVLEVDILTLSQLLWRTVIHSQDLLTLYSKIIYQKRVGEGRERGTEMESDRDRARGRNSRVREKGIVASLFINLNFIHYMILSILPLLFPICMMHVS